MNDEISLKRSAGRRGGATLGRILYGELHEAIVSGSLKPGAKLILEDLCAAYGAGMSPIREALTQLAADKLVQLIPQRGYWVTPLSRADFEDITRTRIDLERNALRRAIRHGSDDWEAGVLASHHQLSKLNARDEAGKPDAQWEERHRAFHLALVSACGSPWSLHFLGILLDQFDRYRRRAETIASEATGLKVSHAMLSEAALAREDEKAAALLTLHVEETAQTVLTALRRHEGPTWDEDR